jgi:hypothetical protein
MRDVLLVLLGCVQLIVAGWLVAPAVGLVVGGVVFVAAAYVARYLEAHDATS